MTLKDIFNTPINEMWDAIIPFATGYLIFSIVIFVLFLSFIVYVFIRIMKEHKEFDKRFKRRVETNKREKR